MPSHIAFEETLVSLVLVGPAASIPQRTNTESAETIMKALRRASGGQQILYGRGQAGEWLRKEFIKTQLVVGQKSWKSFKKTHKDAIELSQDEL